MASRKGSFSSREGDLFLSVREGETSSKRKGNLPSTVVEMHEALENPGPSPNASTFLLSKKPQKVQADGKNTFRLSTWEGNNVMLYTKFGKELYAGGGVSVWV